ncbi:fatty acid desaturase family protein [Psychrobacter sp. FDAARGOS_221]|uniref:fatty acid desaturase family protein n=1 Tax=Psychrobacter sp. FDAARGOS_221 TaxID=1975705 RepID=UPI000BB5823A|nr:fatty acid desaturase [Psychrobacter sp. FDAARGOS_221]PNK60745.1 fatty acid desaturase [Psychrobacter sp. FDAARGOS_221]
MKSQQHLQDKKHIIKQAITQVEWKDLRQLSQWQVAYNLILPYPFLALSWWFASQSLFIFACCSTYLFFASAFRQAHDGYHHSLGVSKRVTTALLMLMSVFLLTSLHAIKATHLQHHRNPLGDDDIEGSLAKLSWQQALVGGVSYRLAIYKQGFLLSNQRNRMKSAIEFVLIGIALLCAVLLIVMSLIVPMLIPEVTNSGVVAMTTKLQNMADFLYFPVLAKVAAYHFIVMFLANALVGIIAVWGVHHDAEGSIARTERNTLINWFTFGLLFHVEHHLFPSVPTNHLPQLAKRLDATMPQLTQNRVLPTSGVINDYIFNTVVRLKDKYSENNDHCPIRKRLAL